MPRLAFNSILFVCTGNICRSPAADGVMRKLVRDAGLAAEVQVDSCGTQGWHVGDPPARPGIERARLRGYDLTPLRARQLAPGDYERFDLILAMDRGHLRRLTDSPAALKADIRLFMEAAPNAGALEVPDPFYGGVEDYDHALDLIEAGCRGWMRHLTAAS